MASPQKENGFTPIANEIMEALVGAGLNGTELSVVLHVLRKTYGYGKKEDWISYTQFEKATGKARPNVWKSIGSLVTKKILVTEKQPQRTVYRLNKDYSQWVVTKSKLVTKKKRTSYEKETQLVTKSKHTKETITKENIQKKGDTPAQEMRKLIVSIEEGNADYLSLVEYLEGKGVPVDIAIRELKAFVSYWTERNKSGTKQRWELQKTFEVKRRLVTWFNRVNDFKPQTKSNIINKIS